MAGSKVYKYGTIYSRTLGLIEGGTLKQKPNWMQIYEKFPPHVEPNFFRPSTTDPIREILYPEDGIRAKFYKKHWSLGTVDTLNSDKTYSSSSQVFIDRYTQIHKNNPDLSEDDVFTKTEEELTAEGKLGRKQRADPRDRLGSGKDYVRPGKIDLSKLLY